jgi:cell wall-associated NlpC family hydrolase
LPRATAEVVPAFDPRVTPLRNDLAAKFLEGKVKAARFVEGSVMEVIAPQAPLRHELHPDGPLDSEALRGERVTVYDTNAEGWAWVQLAADNFVGWLPDAALGPARAPATHRVAALRTFVFPGPSIKQPPIEALPFGAKINIERMKDQMAVTSSGFYVPMTHLKPVGEIETDFVAVAERFLGAPYLWGGKTMLGIDCSGLLQVALTAAGVPCPRDSDMQEQALGRALAGPERSSRLQRGDLIFWEGHVAIVRDGETLVHANAFHMAVAIEPIVQAIARIRATGAEVTSMRRIALA